jgi:hypothetical protein
VKGHKKTPIPMPIDFKIRSLLSHQTGFIPTNPLLFKGMRVYISKNINQKKGLANGSFAVIVDIVFSPNDATTIQHYPIYNLNDTDMFEPNLIHHSHMPEE